MEKNKVLEAIREAVLNNCEHENKGLRRPDNTCVSSCLCGCNKACALYNELLRDDWQTESINDIIETLVG